MWAWKDDEVDADRRMVVYEPSHGDMVTSEVVRLEPSPDGQWIACGAATRAGGEGRRVNVSVRLLDAATGTVKGSPLDRQDFGRQYGLAYTPDARYLIVGHGGSHSSIVHVIDLTTMRVVDEMKAGGSIFDAAADPVGYRFAVGAGDHVVVWSLPSGKR
jgi:DNA-binding beta-propeller fold protein YncE